MATSHPRDVFIVANNIEELGGAIRFVHTLARLLSEQGHRVRLIGVVHPQEKFDYGRDLPYEQHVLHRRHPPRPANPKGVHRLNPQLQARRAVRAAQQRAGARRLTRMLQTSRAGGVLIVAQIFAMEWVRLADTSTVSVIGMSHESFAASKASTRYGRVLRYYRDVDRLLLLTQTDARERTPGTSVVRPRKFTVVRPSSLHCRRSAGSSGPSP